MAGKGGAALRPLVSAVLARCVCAEIPLFFYATETAAAKTLLIFRKPATMDILTIRVFRASSATRCWAGPFFFAPAGTPEPILEWLSTEAVRIVGSPEVRKRLSELGLGALGYSRERSAAFLKSELTNWGEAVRISGARVE